MNSCFDDSDSIYICQKLFHCNEIKLFAWSGNDKREALILFTGGGDFVYHNLDMEKPVIKQISWFDNPVHAPVSICVSPSGCFLLILSQSCLLYIVPICFLPQCPFHCKKKFNADDLVLYLYPFHSKTIGNSSFDDSALNQNKKSKFYMNLHYNCIDLNKFKLKEISCVMNEMSPCAICWWQCAPHEIGIIGTKLGNIIFIDLLLGTKVGEANVMGAIKNLYVCQDDHNDFGILLVSLENNENFKLSLNLKLFSSCHQSEKIEKSDKNLKSNEFKDCGTTNFFMEPPHDETVPHTNAQSTSSRTRLQDFKQMSAGKLASLKYKIAETRSKISIKHGHFEESQNKFSNFECSKPEFIGSFTSQPISLSQNNNEKKLLASFCDHSKILTIHSIDPKLAPVSVHKMSPEASEIFLLCSKVICTISKDKQSIEIISSKLSEINKEQEREFNKEAVLGKWLFYDKSCKSKTTEEKAWQFSSSSVVEESSEIILTVFKSILKRNDSRLNDDLVKIYNVHNPNEYFLELLTTKNCFVITNKSVFVMHLKSNLVKIVLDMILVTYELEKAERICKIFELNLPKLLELAGDIKFKALEFPTAMAFYKRSECGVLKSIVKLACSSHCSQVLNYSLMLMSNSFSEMSLTEKIHLSNFIIMAYTQQILKLENNQKIMKKFIEFLQTNTYFDEVLAINIMGQSFLFPCLHNLIVSKGLILDGYIILIKLMEKCLTSKTLSYCVKVNDFWKCVTEISLIEAIVFCAQNFFTFVNYVSQHLDQLNVDNLKRLSAMLDPTGPCLRPLSRSHQNFQFTSFENDVSQSNFPFGKLVELFLLSVLTKVYKNKNNKLFYERQYLHPQSQEKFLQSSESSDGLISENDESWIPQKDFKELIQKNLKKFNTSISCGFGHTALIRNGNVYTWGQTSQGCLGQGPTMSRNSFPGPVSWLNSFKLKVIAVSCGKNHTAVLTNNGIYTWGGSKYGQLGLGDVKKSPYPRLVTELANKNIICLSCGQFHTLALTDQGTVFAWGWGVHGQLGLGTTDDHRIPRLVNALKQEVIVDVAAGHGHSLVLSNKGRIYSFGSNVFGQLGNGGTDKSSLPVMVKGINERVTAVATGYFHNLALTEFNCLYIWGSSPQSLRFQALARKKSKLTNQTDQSFASAPCNFEFTNSPAKDGDSFDRPSECGFSEKNQKDSHLLPSRVDTSNVTGKIVQISCGCHHSAFVTDSGSLFTWGRSSEGQLGAGNNKEVKKPTQVGGETFQVDCVSCGCEFTVAQEKHSGKIYAWGSNSVGQLAMPIKESASKSLEGKVIVLKPGKKLVRLPGLNAGANSSNVPKEILEIPQLTVTHQIVTNRVEYNFPNLSLMDPEYTEKSLHFVLENYNQCIDLNLVFKKGLEYRNYQFVSKIALIQKNYKESMVYELKALKSLYKHQNLKSTKCERKEKSFYINEAYETGETVFSSVEKIKGDSEQQFKLRNNTYESKTEYIEHAKYILESYLKFKQCKLDNNCERFFPIETGIEFWISESFPSVSLETLFLKKLGDTFRDLAYCLFCRREDDAVKFINFFSTKFLLRLTSEILNLMKTSNEHYDYVDMMSKLLAIDDDDDDDNDDDNDDDDDDDDDSYNDDDNNDNNDAQSISHFMKFDDETGKKELRMESQLKTIEENLFNFGANYDCLKILSKDLYLNYNYYFTCGHNYTSQSFQKELFLLAKNERDRTISNVTDIFLEMNDKKKCNLICPECVKSFLFAVTF